MPYWKSANLKCACGRKHLIFGHLLDSLIFCTCGRIYCTTRSEDDSGRLDGVFVKSLNKQKMEHVIDLIMAERGRN